MTIPTDAELSHVFVTSQEFLPITSTVQLHQEKTDTCQHMDGPPGWLISRNWVPFFAGGFPY